MSKCVCVLQTYVFIPIHVYLSFFIEACLYDGSVTRTSVQTPRDRACLSSPPRWSCLVRQTVKGWERLLSRNAALCIICKNKPSGQRYLKTIYIKQLQKQASVCGAVMQRDHTTSPNSIALRGEEIKKSREKKSRLSDWGGSCGRQVKVSESHSAVGFKAKGLTSKTETLTQLLAHHKEQMWRAKKPAACNWPSGQAKYCLSAPPFYLPLAHLYCPWSHIGTLQSLSTGRGIYGGAIRVISSTGKQWPILVVFDSMRSTAGVNGTQQSSSHYSMVSASFC